MRVDAAKSKYNPYTEPEVYSQDVIKRFKEGLIKLQKEGKLDVDGGNGKSETYLI